MLLQDLIGKVIIRRSKTADGSTLFYNEPCLLLAVSRDKATVCALEDTDDYYAGKQYILGKEFFDDEWVEYGEIVNQASAVRAQVIKRMLDIMGIAADESSILTLCRAVTYKQIYDELRGQLSLDAFIIALEPDIDIFDNTPAPTQQETSVSNNSYDGSEGTSWGDLMPKKAPVFRGFIRRG